MGELTAFITKPDNFDLQWTVKAICSHFTVGYVLSLVSYLFWMRLFVQFTKKIFYQSLFIAFVGGLASLAIDADHVVMFFGWESEYSRPWHPWLAGFASLAIFVTTCFLVKSWWECTICERNINIKWLIISILVWILSLDWIVHVVEDYTLGWF